MPRLSETKAGLEVEKLEREINKIRRETLFIPLGFAAQIFNSACIVGLGLFVLIVFQRPQISEQEKGRLANQKVSIGNFIVEISKISNQEAQGKATKALSRLFPMMTWFPILQKAMTV